MGQIKGENHEGSYCSIVIICAYHVYSEQCSGTDATGCMGTMCSPTSDHSHIQCISKHCTCVHDPEPCLIVNDCSNKKCFDRGGHDTKFHCLDGNCTCIRI